MERFVKSDVLEATGPANKLLDIDLKKEDNLLPLC